MPTIDFWFSIGSTYSYLTVMRLPSVAQAQGITFTWRPFDVRAIMMEIGNSPFIGKPAKSAYMWRDIERRAPLSGLSPRLPAPYPLADLAFANQVALLGMQEGWGEAFTTAAYANWFEKGLPPDQGRELAQATVAGAAALAGQSAEPPATLRAQVTSKGGTTHAAISAMEAAGVGPAIVAAILAAQQRAKELGDAF